MNDLAFMVMPFDDPTANDVYKHCTKPVLRRLDFDVRRSDEYFNVTPIVDDIVTATEQSAIVIVDISGSNPNCFYELGMAHTIKPGRTIMITHDDFSDMPFDVAHLRAIKYEDTIKGKAAFEDMLTNTIVSITQDLSDFYKSEFQIVQNIIGDHSQIAIVGLSNHTGAPILEEGGTTVRGYLGDPNDSTFWASANNDVLEPLLNAKYAEVKHGHITATPKGKAFAKYLENIGVVVQYFGDGKDLPEDAVASWRPRLS